MKRNILIFLTIIITNIIAVKFLWNAFNDGYLNIWTSISSPNGIDKSLSTDNNGNIILTVDGIEYYWVRKEWSVYNKKENDKPSSMGYCKKRETNYGVNPLFIPVDEIARWCGGPEWGAVERFAITNEKEVWYWVQSFSLFDPIIYLFYIAIILVVELCIIMLILLLRATSRKRKKNSSPNPRLEPT